MFDHLVRDGVILFLIGVTLLTKVAPAIRLKINDDKLISGFIWTGWICAVAGFISMCVGASIGSW